MRKILNVISKVIISILIIILFGIGIFAMYNIFKIYKDSYNPENRMIPIENGGNYIIYKDKETNILYFSTYKGATCVIVDENGQPITEGRNEK